MKLFAKVVYNDYDTAIYQEACTQEGFNSLYERGQEIKSNNPDIHYEIGVFTDDYKLFWSIEPFPLKVEKNYLSENFEEFSKEELAAFLSDDFQNDKLEMEFAQKKQKEWERIPDFTDRIKKEIEIWGRLGISLIVSPAELEILKGDRDKAQELLINLIQSDKCTMYGDTYFPELVYNNYLDLEFDLPDTPLHKKIDKRIEKNPVLSDESLDSRINDVKNRVEEKVSLYNKDNLVK